MDAVYGRSAGLLTTAELAAREDFRVGEAVVSPSARTVSGPGGTSDVEPRVMQVLVVLADSAGHVVTRDTLFQRCWGGVYVGDDSLNRAIGSVRKLAGDIAAGSFQIETIPRTGYRLIGTASAPLASSADDELTLSRGLSRRQIAGGTIGMLALGGIGAWAALRPRTDPRFGALMARGDEALRSGALRPDAAAEDDQAVVDIYEQAVRANPDSAKAWGLLAYFRSRTVGDSSAADSGRIIRQTEDAVHRALAIDRREPNALTAMFLLQGPMLDWTTRERRLRDILAIDGSNIPALAELMTLLQATGFTRESWRLNERILQLAPFSRPHLVVRAMKLWILGDVNASDQVIDRVRGMWPLYEFAFLVRLMLFTLTGRPRAARSMVENAPPNMLSNPRLWLSATEAIESRTADAIERARMACLDVARKAPWASNMAVMILGALGQTDAAFEITDGYLLWRGKVVSAEQDQAQAVNDYNRRMTQWLFTPPCAAMRADPRFLNLCEQFGLTAYWRNRGVKPDYMLTQDAEA